HARASLALGHGINHRLHTVWELALLARIATVCGDAERAGRLWGAIEAEEAREPLALFTAHRDELAAPILAASGPNFERGREAGRKLTLDEAIEYALDDTDA
ncbi:MAG: hypothetical protein H0U03_00915, partial [Actinobacteria bacterium]|nr:hypothetical protein [Actinomycetota bacterium]